LQVYALYAALLLMAFNRLPLRLPTRGPLAGRKHNKGGENSSTPVMFADVAGVDEAKEELQEIVVSACPCWTLCGLIMSQDGSLCVDLRIDLCWLLCKPCFFVNCMRHMHTDSCCADCVLACCLTCCRSTCARLTNSASLARGRLAVCCWWGLQARERRCWRVQLQVGALQCVTGSSALTCPLAGGFAGGIQQVVFDTTVFTCCSAVALNSHGVSDWCVVLVAMRAGEADVPFFSISASEFVELYVGMGAMRVRELFTNARKEAPAIVFIDEIDAVAKGRDMRLRSVGNDEREQTLNQLLTELDGFDSDKVCSLQLHPRLTFCCASSCICCSRVSPVHKQFGCGCGMCPCVI
jgi:hypothetical protein